MFIASVGLWVSRSYDLGEIAGEIACNLMMLFAFAAMRYATGDAGDEAISESYKCMYLSPVDNSSVDFFPFTVNALFPTLPRLVAS